MKPENLPMAKRTIQYTGPGRVPARTYDNDAGYDLYTYFGHAYQGINIEPGDTVDVPTGISVAFPTGWYGRIVGRSSTVRNRGLLVIEGIIDEGFRGELFTCVHNPGSDTVWVGHEERLAQLILHQTSPAFDFFKVEDLPLSERGESGFGSSGL